MTEVDAPSVVSEVAVEVVIEASLVEVGASVLEVMVFMVVGCVASEV